MELIQLIEKVFNQYAIEKNKTFKNNGLAGTLRRGLKDVDVARILVNGSLETIGSAGEGNWAYVPWIGVFDKNISISAQKGFYIVYLFSSDMESLYLSLNQGWTYFRKVFGRDAQEKILEVAKYWQKSLTTRTDRMNSNKIDLSLSNIKNTTLPQGYELGNIFSIHYSKDNLPSNDQMLEDLQGMIYCLNELKNKLINSGDIGQSIDFILSTNTISNQTLTDKNIQTIANKVSSAKLLKKSPAGISSKFNGRKINFQKENERNSKIGFLGEQIILENEKRKLEYFPNLRDKIEHVSQTKGDGLGYDILSFDEQGHEMYIEVKTTTQGQDAPFFISKNELEFSKLHKDKYFLYRIFNFDKILHSNEVEYFEKQGDINELFNLTPMSFLSSIK